jgi:MYXO-CTERM domain-containing protein
MSEATNFSCGKKKSGDSKGDGSNAKSTIEVTIKKVATLPECESKTFDSGTATTLSCSDGFSLSIPAGVMDPYSTEVSVTVDAVVTPYKSNVRPGSFYGWRIKGTKVATSEAIITLNGYATLTCPCDTTQLTAVGLTLASTECKYYDPSQDAYKDVACTQDTSSCKVTMSTNHWTDFVITGNGNLKGLDGTPEGVTPPEVTDTGSGSAASNGSGGCGCHTSTGPTNWPTALLGLLPLIPALAMRRVFAKKRDKRM